MVRSFSVRRRRTTPVPSPTAWSAFPIGQTQTGSPRRRNIVAALAALGVLIPTVLVVAVQPAGAGWACDHLGKCGQVINNTDRPMLIAEFKGRQWCVRDSGDRLRCTTRTLHPGDDAGGRRGAPKDVDGVAFARTGFYYVGTPLSEYYVAPNRYLKITDGQRLRCTQPGPVATPRCKPF